MEIKNYFGLLSTPAINLHAPSVTTISVLVEIMVMKVPRKKVLVADCHDDVLIILEKLLEDAGFDTTTVWTAKDAVTLLDSDTYDLVLVNRYLPDAECEDLVKALAKRNKSLICIVMLPTLPETSDFTNFEALGARDVLCKYAYRQVVETVNQYLACRPPLFAA